METETKPQDKKPLVIRSETAQELRASPAVKPTGNINQPQRGLFGSR